MGSEAGSASEKRSGLLKRAILVVLAVLVALVVLFVINGVLLAKGETPIQGTTDHPPAPKVPPELKILAYNIAKGFAHEGGVSFDEPEAVRARLADLATVINDESPDLVFLSEALKEADPCPVDQVVTLAEATGMHQWVFGENANFGLPFYRVITGNAILSRHPIEPVSNPDLHGRKPFYISRNNRRVLLAALDIHGQRTLLASIHTDSFDPPNNLAQTRQLLELTRDTPAILAGDFNARPGSPSIDLIKTSGRFVGQIEGPPTFPAHKPDRRIDFIFAPSAWTLLEARTIADQTSDHLAVVAIYEVVSGANP